MIRRRLNTINFFLRIATLLLPLLAFAIAGYLRFFSGLIPLRYPDIDYTNYFGLLFFTTIVWAVVVDHYKLFQFDHLFADGGSARSIFWACCVAYVAVIGATFFYRSTSFSRLFVAISAVSLFILAAASQKLFRATLERARRRGRSGAQILMIGSDGFAEKAARSLLESMLTPCTIAAFVQLSGQEIVVDGSPVIALEDVRKIAAAQELDDVIIAIPPARFAEIPEILAHLEHLCVPVRAVLDLGTNLSVREMLFDFGGLRLLDLRASPSESIVYLVAKRSFDLIFSALLLVVCSPLMAAVAIVVRLSSPGPVLFTQERVGLNGRIFRMYKFRTMNVSDPYESATRWTTADDPRRTRMGAFLRATNLDELPQFFNVLKGDMSIVGPRPERPHFVQKFLEDVAQYNTRHYLKVGITGWAQVNGWRGDTSIARRVEHDLYYLRNWSLLLDFKIILLTVFRTVATNKNAY